MDKTDRLRDYGLAFLLYEQGLGVCGYELIRELFIFVKLILNSYLTKGFIINGIQVYYKLFFDTFNIWNRIIATKMGKNLHSFLPIRYPRYAILHINLLNFM